MLLTLELRHQLHGQVLVADVEHDRWTRLEDSLWDVSVGEEVQDLRGVSHVVLVTEIEWIPLPVHVRGIDPRSAVGVERLVHQIVDVQGEVLVEALLRHVLSIDRQECIRY